MRVFRNLWPARVWILIATAWLLSACGVSRSESEALNADDFLLPAASEHDDGHDHGDDGGHNEDPGHDEEASDAHEESAFDHGLTETGEDGVFIDHHGNRVVDELYQKYEVDGLRLEFTVENFLGVGGRGGEVTADIRAGERALVKFKISDATTGKPMTGVRPLAWLDLQNDGHTEGDAEAQAAICQNKVEGYLSGMLTARPTVNLNSFFMLAMNNDASISVIDPTVDVAGMTQLFALIQLAQPGEDWVLASEQETLFVTLPDANQVAAASMDGFQLAQHINGGTRPVRIALQPDERLLWVGNDASDQDESGVTVIDPATYQTAAFIASGSGHHEISFTPDSQTAFVSNGAEGTVSAINTSSLEVIGEMKVGSTPVAMAFDSGALYVGDNNSGRVSVFDGQDFSLQYQVETSPGLARLAFGPEGRWLFATSPERGTISIIDTDSGLLTHRAEVPGAPDQIVFSDGAAYFRSLDEAAVYVLPLADLAPDSSLELASIPVGQQAPGIFPSLSSADAMHHSAKQGAVMIANPAEDQIFFLPEGATASSGSFQGHGLFPRAVSIIDRSMQEDAPGVYSGRLRIPSEGNYLVALMLSDPFVVHCFEFNAKHNAELDAAAMVVPEITFAENNGVPSAGQPHSLAFTLSNPQTGENVEGLEDLQVMASQITSNWSARTTATALGEGQYEVLFTYPNTGLYTLYFSIPSLGIEPGRMPTRNIMVPGS